MMRPRVYGTEAASVGMEQLQSAPYCSPDDARAEPLGGAPEWERALHALERRVGRGSGIVVFDGPDGAGKSTGLRELMRRLPPVFRVVRLAGEALTSAELSGRVLDVLGAPRGRDSEHLVALHAAHLRAEGRSLVLLVDDADTLPDETVRWLASLIRPRETGVRVVLALHAYAVLLDALAGLGLCVDLVRLDPDAVTRPARADGRVEQRRAGAPPTAPTPPSSLGPEPAPASPAERLAPAESPLVEKVAREPIAPLAAASPPNEMPSAPPSPERERDHLLALEELLGTAEPPCSDPSEPDSGVDGAAFTHREPGAGPSALPARPLGPAPRGAGSSLTRPSPPRATTAVSIPETPPISTLEPQVPRASGARKSLAHLARWLVAACAAAVVWLALPELRGKPAASVSSPSPAVLVSSRPAPVAPARAAAPNLDRQADPATPDAGFDGAVDISDLWQAIELIGAGSAGDSHDAALFFLREHGPDAEGYALLDEFDTRRPDDPEEAVRVLAARSRVRAALCAAWADDVRGEAPERLGCPGAMR